VPQEQDVISHQSEHALHTQFNKQGLIQRSPCDLTGTCSKTVAFTVCSNKTNWETSPGRWTLQYQFLGDFLHLNKISIKHFSPTFCSTLSSMCNVHLLSILTHTTRFRLIARPQVLKGTVILLFCGGQHQMEMGGQFMLQPFYPLYRLDKCEPVSQSGCCGEGQ
jgi:hypothetical protein